MATKSSKRAPNDTYVGRVSINNIKLSVSYIDLKNIPEHKIAAKKMRPFHVMFDSQNQVTLNSRTDFHEGFA